ncbi:hypothetical protein DFH09DRAFT_1405428 [Mycena vulgaris]|nr:hypothetical protein DFH09DRAFT_1405428 [Mycena vulgaris]
MNGGGRRESRKREMREWERMWREIGEVVGRDGEQGKRRETGRERMMKGWEPKREESARCGPETRRTGTVERKMKLCASLSERHSRPHTSDASPQDVPRAPHGCTTLCPTLHRISLGILWRTQLLSALSARMERATSSCSLRIAPYMESAHTSPCPESCTSSTEHRPNLSAAAARSPFSRAPPLDAMWSKEWRGAVRRRGENEDEDGENRGSGSGKWGQREGTHMMKGRIASTEKGDATYGLVTNSGNSQNQDQAPVGSGGTRLAAVVLVLSRPVHSCLTARRGFLLPRSWEPEKICITGVVQHIHVLEVDEHK